MKRSVWILVMAAGYSRRMGSCKLLLPVGEETMLRSVVKKTMLTRADGVVVVVNAEFSYLISEIRDLSVTILSNNFSNLGMSSSLRLGIEHLSQIGADGAIVLLADQPEIDPSVIDQVICRYEHTGAPIVQAVYEGKPGHPVLFSKTLFGEFQGIAGDQGGREILRKYAEKREVVCISRPEPEDIDTFEDYQRVIGKGGCRN
ncbi:nucleotidyltransferase family protein [Effusibacillus consociatus]|uniref:NTP transferase domain-containing protein n=1 Tax=Effusibacillus consociatus TaxID=1117041 RepID=A0ABV9Q0B6_9BACL